MSRILKLHLLIIISVTIYNGLANAQAKKYFPLQIGNKWIYEYHWEDPNHNTIDRIDTLVIIGTTSQYYRFNRYFLYYTTFKGDSSLFKIENNKVTRKVFGKEMTWYDFSLRVGDSWIIPVQLIFPSVDTVDIIAILKSKTDIFVFGQDTIKNCYRFQFKFDTNKIYDLTPWEELFAPNIGLMEKKLAYKGLDWHIYKLKKAIINNKPITVVSENRANPNSPRYFLLNQNYPNPFYSTTRISYQVVGDPNAKISLRIYNLLGQEIKTFIDGFQSPGFYHFIWDGKNNFGKEMPSGVYWYALTREDFREVRKIVLKK